jgi:putative FmdB family regulatory protein
MPLYEYQCDKCGRRFEIIQKMSDPLVEKCPTCGGPVHKLQSAPAFQFKGSGWYVTDYARKDQSGSTKAEGESKDAKPAEKSDQATEKSNKTSEGTKSTASTAASSSTTGPTSSSSAPSAERNQPWLNVVLRGYWRSEPSPLGWKRIRRPGRNRS